MNKGKAPAFQFYVRDWLSDPLLRQASLLSRGAWIDCLCFMWEADERGRLKTTPIKLTRMLSASIGEISMFLNELYDLRFGEISGDEKLSFPKDFTNSENCNTIVTLENRRMYGDYKNKENTRLRVRRHREKRKRNAKSNPKVTPSSSSSTSSTKNKRKFNQKDFDLFYSLYPNKKEPNAALSRWKILLKSGQLPNIQILLDAIKKQIEWRKNPGDEFVPAWKNPATWLNKGCWEDEVSVAQVSTRKPLTEAEQRAELDRDE